MRRVTAPPVLLIPLLFALVALASALGGADVGRTLLLAFAGLCLALAWTALMTLSRRLGGFAAGR